MKFMILVLTALFGVLMITAGYARASADTIYYNGAIFTIACKEPTSVETLMVRAGKIAFTGSPEQAMAIKDDSTTSNEPIRCCGAPAAAGNESGWHEVVPRTTAAR